MARKTVARKGQGSRPRPRGRTPKAGAARGHEASFTVETGPGPAGARRLRALEAALAPEITGGAPGAPGAAGDTVTMRVLPGRRGVEVRLTSASLASLRAALNAHMRMATLALEVADVVAIEEE